MSMIATTLISLELPGSTGLSVARWELVRPAGPTSGAEAAR